MIRFQTMEQPQCRKPKCTTIFTTKTAQYFFILLGCAQSIRYSFALEVSESLSRRLNQEQPRCVAQLASCQARGGSSKLPLSEWNNILSRVSGVANLEEVRSAIAKLAEIDFSNVELLDDIDSYAAAEIITDFEATTRSLEGPNILEETEVTANQIGAVGEFLNILNVVFDFVKKTTGLDLRFLATVIGNVIAAQALGIGPILSAVISGVASLAVAIVERLAWLVVQITGLRFRSSRFRSSESSCYSELMKCETSSMISVLVPGLVSGVFAAMKNNSKEGSP